MSDELKTLDRELVRQCRDIHVLAGLSWPLELQARFLGRWEAGRPDLPKVVYRNIDYADKLRSLDAIARRAEIVGGPLGNFLLDTARSYHTAARMVMRAGSNVAGVLAVELYGRPGLILPGTESTTLDAARHFLGVSQYYEANHRAGEADYCLPAQVVADSLRRQLATVFDAGAVSVVVDPTLAAKAAAGATRIRLRDATCFSHLDVNQLLQHEAFVHSLTALNGRAQPTLTALSLGAPRTTMTQEGLATFAELITGAIDISRMKRIALRIVGVDAAQRGANFIDVFKLFVDAGQPLVESYNSAQRIFRGVPVTGGTAFTKDCVYLEGLLLVHTFFRWALASNRLGLCEHLFAGRMALDDVLSLEPLFRTGELRAPARLPPWMSNVTGLTAYLAFSVFANNISINGSLLAEFEALADR